MSRNVKPRFRIFFNRLGEPDYCIDVSNNFIVATWIGYDYTFFKYILPHRVK